MIRKLAFYLFALLAISVLSFQYLAHADMPEHSKMAKHRMILFGESSVYASHIVYKSPHNFQVILQISLPDEVKARYLEAVAKSPTRLVILLLDPLDLKNLESGPTLTGRIFSEDADGTQYPIADRVQFPSTSYRLVYFDELPLSLSPDSGYLTLMSRILDGYEVTVTGKSPDGLIRKFSDSGCELPGLTASVLKRCQAEGLSGCTVFSSGPVYCSEHQKCQC